MGNGKPRKAQPITQEEQLWKAKADLANSLLQFRKRAADSLDNAIADAVRNGADSAAAVFETAGGRPAAVVLLIGEEYVAALLQTSNSDGESR